VSGPTLADRARGCLLGLAAGDALGRPAENLTPEEITRRWGRLTELEPGPDGIAPGTDDTEYAIFAALLLDTYGSALTSADVARTYRERILPEDGPMKGAGFSERGTAEALRRGLEPPLTGLAHRHGWSDGLAMRAAPYGVFAAGDPAEAARLAAVDGAVSQSGEGVHGGRAVAAAVAVAMTGAAPAAVVAAGLAAVPADSWTARSIGAAIRAEREAPSERGGRLRDEAGRGESEEPSVTGELAGTREDLARRLHEAVVTRHYPWTDLAPEAVALAFAAYLAGGGDVEESVVTAVSLGRDADTTAAIAGALAGAGRGESGVPRRWADAIGPARGTCLPLVAGRDVREVADLLVRRG
jgi:ADP-ribosylglycohydrolase